MYMWILQVILALNLQICPLAVKMEVQTQYLQPEAKLKQE